MYLVAFIVSASFVECAGGETFVFLSSNDERIALSQLREIDAVKVFGSSKRGA